MSIPIGIQEMGRCELSLRSIRLLLSLCALVVCGALLTEGCSKHKYDTPHSAYAELDPGYEVGPDGELKPDYYVLAYSQFNVSGRRQPTCPFEVIDSVQARSSDLGDTWEEDKAHVTGAPRPTGSPSLDDIHQTDPGPQGQDFYVPARLESKLLALLREKAQRLDADAVVNIAIYLQDDSGASFNVQHQEIGGKPFIEKITGEAIRFADPDCRQ